MKETIKKIVSQILLVPVEEITDNFGRGNPESWDSLAHILIVTACEEVFSLKLTTGEVVKCMTVADINNCCSRHKEKI